MKKVLISIILLLLIGQSFTYLSKFQVDSKKCIGCNECVKTKICPVNAISFNYGKAQVDLKKCIGCKLCVVGNNKDYKQCPSVAFYEVAVPNPQPQMAKKVIKTTPKDTSGKTTVFSSKPETTGPKQEKKGTIKQAIKEILYIVNKEACISCQLCVSSCPSKSITMVNEKAVIDTRSCTKCGICINGNGNDFAGCPVKAIYTK